MSFKQNPEKATRSQFTKSNLAFGGGMRREESVTKV
jgi:hypothetical protein